MAKVSDWNLIRANQSYFELFQNLFLNQSEKRFEFRLMENGQKCIRIIPIYFALIQNINPNESELGMI